MITFHVSKASEHFQEALPLLEAHWQEIAHFKDIPLDPDYEAYKKIEAAGFLRCYTARWESGPVSHMVGYAVYFLRYHPHYKSSLQASQDILYIDPKYRGGTGARFINWCDDQLRAEHVQVVYHHVKAAHNFGPLLERFGYELQDLIYGKRLDKEE